MTNDNRFSSLIKLASDVTRDADPALRPHLSGVVLQYLLNESTPLSAAARAEDARHVRAMSLPSSPGTLAEAVSAAHVRAHPDRLVTIAAYRFENGVEAITTDEFAAAYREVRVPRPQNLHANIGTCVTRGWLAEADKKEGRKAWRVTQTGLKHARELIETSAHEGKETRRG